MARPGASKARGIGAARLLALSERTQRFVLDGGHGFGMAQPQRGTAGHGSMDSLPGQVHDDNWMTGRSARMGDRIWRRQGAYITPMASRALEIHYCIWRRREAICLCCVCDRVWSVVTRG